MSPFVKPRADTALLYSLHCSVPLLGVKAKEKELQLADSRHAFRHALNVVTTVLCRADAVTEPWVPQLLPAGAGFLKVYGHVAAV